MTPNELRELCNLPLIDNPLLDQFYMNAGRVPLELVGVGSYNGSTVAPVAIENTPVTTTT